MPVVKLDGTYYYGPRGAKVRYGPGDAVEVPEGLATALGLQPIGVPLVDAPADTDTESDVTFTPAPDLVDEVNTEPEPAAEPTPRRARKAKGDADPE
jgi:hypothetical protein